MTSDREAIVKCFIDNYAIYLDSKDVIFSMLEEYYASSDIKNIDLYQYMYNRIAKYIFKDIEFGNKNDDSIVDEEAKEADSIYDRFMQSISVLGVEKTFLNFDELYKYVDKKDAAFKAFIYDISGTLKLENFFEQKLNLINHEGVYDYTKLNNKFLIKVLKKYICLLNAIDLSNSEKIPDSIIDNNLKIYMHDINQIPIFTSERTFELAKLYRENGDENAKELLINSNLKLVVSIASKYTNKGLSLMDLIQEGNSGLITAIDKYDYKKGVRFTTYAYWWIKQGIKNALSETSRNIRIPRNLNTLINKYQRLENEYYQIYEQKPSYEYMSQKMGLPVKKLEKLDYYSKMQNTLSLDIKVENDSDDTWELIDFMESDGLQQIYDDVDANFFKDKTQELSLKLKYILTDVQYRTYVAVLKTWDGNKVNYSQAAKKIGVTRMCVTATFKYVQNIIKNKWTYLNETPLEEIINRSKRHSYAELNEKRDQIKKEVRKIMRTNRVAPDLKMVLFDYSEYDNLRVKLKFFCPTCETEETIYYSDFIENPNFHNCSNKKLMDISKINKNLNLIHLSSEISKLTSGKFQVIDYNKETNKVKCGCITCGNITEASLKFFETYGECVKCKQNEIDAIINNTCNNEDKGKSRTRD